MNRWLAEILDKSEVWALIFPITAYFIYRPSQKWVTPLFWYLMITLLLNFCIDVLDDPWLRHLPPFKKSNHFFYNLNSLSRFLCFTWFFYCLHNLFHKYNMIVVPLFLAGTAFNFIFLTSIFDFSSKLLATETAMLMIYCISWFYIKVSDEKSGPLFSDKFSWVIVGVSFYAAINFFIFLFYNELMAAEFKKYAVGIWDVHNITFIILCLLITKSFVKK